MVPLREGGFAAADGTALYFRAWEAEAPIARLLLIHGFTEHSGRHENTGNDLAAGGITAFAFDLRGHGRSEGRRGDAPGMTALLDDVTRFRREIDRHASADLPLFLLGHSLGGLIALRYRLEHAEAFAGGIVIAPWLGLVSAPRWKIALGRAVAPLLPGLPVPAGIEPDDLSRDLAVVRSYRNDPLVQRRITPRMFLAVEDAITHVIENAARLQPPLLLILAGEDRIVDTRRSLALAARFPPGDFEVVVEPGAYHEVLNDPDRAGVIARILAWVRDRVAPDGRVGPESGDVPAT